MTRLISFIVRRAREERLAQAAGGLAFTTVLSLVPLLVVSFAAFTRVPFLRRVGEALREHLLRGVLPAELARTVLKQFAQFTANAGGLTLAGSLFLLVSAVSLLVSLENTLNRIWQVKKPRPLLRRLGLYAVLLLTGPVIVGASLWATSALLASPGSGLAARAAWWPHVLEIGSVLLGAAAFAALLRFVPNAAVRRRDAIAGGLLAGAAFELGKRGFAWYLVHVPTYRTVYGAFAPVLVFLLWVYYSWLVTLAAALVSANLPRTGTPRSRRLARS